MSTSTNGLDKYADSTKDMIDSAADTAKDSVNKAQNRLEGVFAAAKDTAANVQKRAVESAKAADKVVRANPYQAIAVAFGVGALVGYWVSRRD